MFRQTAGISHGENVHRSCVQHVTHGQRFVCSLSLFLSYFLLSLSLSLSLSLFYVTTMRACNVPLLDIGQSVYGRNSRVTRLRFVCYKADLKSLRFYVT